MQIDREPRYLDALPTDRAGRREAERRAMVAELRAMLAGLSDDALRARARGHALPSDLPRAELIHALASHETGSRLTVLWAAEDAGDLPCPGCDEPLPSGAVCACGWDDRPATEMERAFAAHVREERVA